MRASIHYLFSFSILSLYGGQVCPFVESLNILPWGATLAIFFAVLSVVRYWALQGFVEDSPYQSQAARQYALECAVFIGGGIVVASYNTLFHNFPVESGVKILAGFLVLSFFIATDLSLQRERRIALRLKQEHHDLNLRRHSLSVTRKFALVAIVCSVSVTAIVFLVFSKDLEWLTQLPQEQFERAELSILGELSFVMLTLLSLVLNLILSYSRNMKLFLQNENGALVEVATGNLNAHVPVSTNDEFGVMAEYTNQMIDRLREQTRELILTQDVTIHGMASLAETRDNETGKHILRTQHYIRLLAEHLREHPRFCEILNDESIELIFKSAPLHDIGKVGVPDRILLKPGRLNPEEFEEMKRHTLYGRNALLIAEKRLGSNSFLRFARQIAYTHHEKWDGSGYPQGLKADEIPCAGRLMALADVYDALISKRVYKPAFSHKKAKKIILEGRGIHFDPDVVDMFIELEEEFQQIARKYADS